MDVLPPGVSVKGVKNPSKMTIFLVFHKIPTVVGFWSILGRKRGPDPGLGGFWRSIP